MTTQKPDEGLKRVVGVTGLTAAIVNLSIGGGIYGLPAIIGMQLGAAGVIGFLLCGLMFAAIILCYVEIGSRIKTSGGSYAYVEAAFGPFAGFIVNWLFFFGWGILSSAAVMNIVADSLAVVTPAFSKPLMRVLLFTFLIGLMILINVRSAKRSVQFVNFVTLIKLIPLVWIIIFGISHIQPGNLHWEEMPSIKSFGDTALILFFAFAGFESSLSVSGEIKNPSRTVPLGVLCGGLIVFFTYILIQTVAFGVLGPEIELHKGAPLAAVGERIAGIAGVTIILLAAALSGLGSVTGDVLASPRLLFAGAKDGMFPKFLGQIHPRFATPHWAVIVYGGLILLFSVSGGFKQLAILASGALLLIYLAVVLSLIKFRIRKIEPAEKSFKVPGGYVIPGIAIAAILYVLSNLSTAEVSSICVFVGVVCIIYVVMKWWPKRHAS